MKYKLKRKELILLEIVKKHFEEAERFFNDLEPQTQEAINQEHNEGTSLNHCLRWGLNAVEELIENPILQNY